MCPLLSVQVRLALLSKEYIKNTLMSNRLVSKNNECLEIANDAMQTISHMATNRLLQSDVQCKPFARPRLPDAVLLITASWSDYPFNGIKIYNVCANTWIGMLKVEMRPRGFYGAVCLNEHVYCVGGYDVGEHFNTLHRFDLSTSTWHKAAPMHYHRSYVSVTVLNGCIYAIGGSDGQTQLSTAEHYRPETNQWTLIAPMHEKRTNASCTVLHSKVSEVREHLGTHSICTFQLHSVHEYGSIYICGGFNGSEDLKTAEYYNPETNQWTLISQMNSRRSGIRVIAYADHVYAVGGFDGIKWLSSAEAYNPQTNAWHTVSSMLSPRGNFGIEVIDNLLFVVGGFCGSSSTREVEYYDVTTNVWLVACHLEATDVPSLSPNDIWDWLQAPVTLNWIGG
ncbi:kelch-like protein 10 [Channa argus]|uniref:kelch-like protein 10 n=1 Tax=Channa argus TaxID=215402 RepID=UPI00351FF8B3